MQEFHEKKRKEKGTAFRRGKRWHGVLLCLAAVVVFATTYALILPAMTLEQASCGLEEHVHTADCYVQTAPAEPPCAAGGHSHTADCYDEAGVLACGLEEAPAHVHSDLCDLVTADTLTCQLPEGEGHTHGPDCYDETGALVCLLEEWEGHRHTALCYGTWELACGLEEHTHTEECELPAALTEEEQAQVEEVIALIDALPTQEEIDETLVALEEAGDEDGRDDYLAAVVTQSKAAYAAYSSLTEAQRVKVVNAAKLMALEPFWSAQTLLDIGEKLDGDYAYISELHITNAVDGATPWDGNDEAGNDSGPSNGIVRSFDMLSYTVTVRNRVRGDAPFSYYKEGTLYFEFVLPASDSQAMFDVDKMNWLRAKPEIEYQITKGIYDGKTAQFLRGSFLWQPSEGNETAIGESYIELNVYLRVLAMTQGDTLQPEFTFWLEGNQVPADAPVTGSGNSCLTHGTDHATVSATPVVVSSTPRYNIVLNDGRRHLLSTYDFGIGNEKALNKDAGSVYGRRVNYGLAIQIYGVDAAHGLRGCEIPNGEDITFDLDISSKYVYSDANVSILLFLPRQDIHRWSTVSATATTVM